MKPEVAIAIRGMNAQKFGNRFTNCQFGHRHRSKREAERCTDLHLLAQAGSIQELRNQPRFPLEVNGELVCTYVADWDYVEAGVYVVEDCKGKVTEGYRIKRALMRACRGIKIKET